MNCEHRTRPQLYYSVSGGTKDGRVQRTTTTHSHDHQRREQELKALHLKAGQHAAKFAMLAQLLRDDPRAIVFDEQSTRRRSDSVAHFDSKEFSGLEIKELVGQIREHEDRGRERIYFSSSTNGGESWWAKVDVSNAPPEVEHCFPAITAGGAGDVRVAWMDTRMADEQNRPLWNTFLRSSTNGGATWSSESQLSGPVRGYDYILPRGFLSPFGNLFSIGIDNLGTTQVVWGEGQNYKSPGSIWYARGR